MKKKYFSCPLLLHFIIQTIFLGNISFAQESIINRTLDDSVMIFLEKKSGSWRDMNVPESDGKILYEIIIKNNYKHLEKYHFEK